MIGAFFASAGPVTKLTDSFNSNASHVHTKKIYAIIFFHGLALVKKFPEVNQKFQ